MKEILLILTILLIAGCAQEPLFDMETFEDFKEPRTAAESGDVLNGMTWAEVAETEEFSEGLYYNLFHTLFYFSYHEDKSYCIEKLETPECVFLNAIYNNDEELCLEFPEQRTVEQFSPPSSGGVPASYHNVTYYYRDACKAYAAMYKEYTTSTNQLEFCNQFSVEFGEKACKIFTCNSYYEQEPDECIEYMY